MNQINSSPLKKSKNLLKESFNQNEEDNSSKKSGSSQSQKNKEKKPKDFNLLNIIDNINKKSLTTPEDPLFEEIQKKLESPAYAQNELISDMKLLLNRNPFIKPFNNHSYFNKNSFEIFGKQPASKIICILNLINYINVINAIRYYTRNDPNQFPILLNELSINFSCVEDKINTKYVNVVLMTPKSPVLYNYISTRGNLGIKDKAYKKLVKEYCTFGDKYTFDNGYCYEDISVSHLIELLGENTFKIRPNVMYYVEKKVAKKLVDSGLVEIPKDHELNKSNNSEQYSGYKERALIISMLQTVPIELNINFREIINHDLKVENNRLLFEKDTTYIFEIKVLINDIIRDKERIEDKQQRFIYALKNVKINGEFQNKGKNFKYILMCDHNPIEVKEIANNVNSKFKISSLRYSGIQLGITFVNTLNNNIKILNKKIDVLEEKDESKNEKIESQNKKIATLEGENKSKNNKIDSLEKNISALKGENESKNKKIDSLEKNILAIEGENESQNEKIDSLEKNIAALQEQNKIILEELKALKKGLAKKNNEVNTITNLQAKDNDKDKNDNNSDKRLKSLQSVFIDNFISISSLLKEPNIGLLIRETFETVFKYFEKILEEILQNNDNMLCSKVESLINGKGNISVAHVKKLLSDKIAKGNSCSPYYEAIKELLFGIDEKVNCDVLIGLEKEKKKYLIKLIGSVEIFENNQGIHDIERKLEGALLYIILELLGIEKFNSLVDNVNKKNVENDRFLMKLLISSINLVNNDINN